MNLPNYYAYQIDGLAIRCNVKEISDQGWQDKTFCTNPFTIRSAGVNKCPHNYLSALIDIGFGPRNKTTVLEMDLVDGYQVYEMTIGFT